VVAYEHDESTSKPHIFRSYDHPRLATPNKDEIRLNDEPASLARIWKVARATSAAAGYFRKQDIENCTYEDDGMGTNNPSFYIYTDVGQINGGRTPNLIVSIGTGTKDKIRKSTAKQRARRSHGRNPLKYSKGLYHSLRQLSEIVTDPEKDHKQLESSVDGIKDKLRTHNIPSEYPRYFRFNVPGLGAEVALDEWHPSRDPGQPNQTLAHIREVTDKYLARADVQE
jgi:patatin-like phospholipase/acyl hydrolase